MPFRTTINGLSVECDTPSELLALAKKQPSSMPIGRQEPLKLEPVNPIKPVKANMKAKRARIKSNRRGFVGNGKSLLEALKEAYPTSMSTTQLADRLGLAKLAIPSIIMGLRSRANHEKLDFESLVKKEEKAFNGVVMGSYQITERGIEALQKYGY